MQLYKILDAVGSLSSVTAVVQEEAAEVGEVKEQFNCLSLLVCGLKSSIGNCPSHSSFASDIWSALLELEGKVDAQLAFISQKMDNAERRTGALVKLLEGEDDDLEMSGCGDLYKSHTPGEHDCCSHCTKHFDLMNVLMEVLQWFKRHCHSTSINLELGACPVPLDPSIPRI